MKNFINGILSIAHFRSLKEGFFNMVITVISFLLGYFRVIIMDNINLFMAIAVVVLVDFLFGSSLAIKKNKWETKKALKLIYYMVAYPVILITVLAIEKGYPSAFFLTEAIIMPILLFQTISIVKNASLLGLIPQGTLLEILNKIDNYKNTSIETK